MSDPISLIQSFLPSFDTASTNSTTAESTADSSSSSNTAPGSTPDYALSPSLATILSRGASTELASTALATYGAQAVAARSLLSDITAATSDSDPSATDAASQQ